MKLPRWTTYPAMAALWAMALVAFPRPAQPDPYAGAAARKLASEAGLPAAASAKPARGRRKCERVVVLGIDGMDPDILAETCKRFPERMSNFRALIAAGDGIQVLGTSLPPQSPVAWSNFITGRRPGGHGVFDFIHRDPVTRGALTSTTRAEPSSTVDLPGKWRFPLGGDTESNRSGPAFWTVLAQHGVPADIWRMPVNFPVEPAKGLSFPGMLTPALDGGYGEFTIYTTVPTNADVDGGRVITVQEFGGRIDTTLIGPENVMRDPRIDAASGAEVPVSGTVPMKILVDHDSRSAFIDLNGGEAKLLLGEGQWSGFVEVTFDMLPADMLSMAGIVRFYLRSVEPELELYASPINIDPLDPATTVSEPPDASKALADPRQGIGLYYTQGMAEEVNALKAELLTPPEFMDQAELVYEERVRMMDYALDHYLENDQGGFLFFYYSTVDLTNHMVWDLFDEKHPHFRAELASQDNSAWTGRPGSRWHDVIYDVYMRMDPVLGRLRQRLGDDATLIVMSDHGFAPYYRTFSLNTWLYENDYLVLRDGLEKELPEDDPGYRAIMLTGTWDDDGDPATPPVSMVDWERTRAYGMGFNGLYLNVKGREGCDASGKPVPGAPPGSVDPADAPALLAELKSKLEAIRDPGNDNVQVVVDAVITSSLVPDSAYQGERAAEAPDMQVGYNIGYENSELSTIGQVPHNVLEDNMGGSFVGSHLMAPELVPGMLISNRPIAPGQHALEDLTVEILARYGIDPVDGMAGHRVLRDTTP